MWQKKNLQMRYPSASPSMSLDQRVETSHKLRPNAGVDSRLQIFRYQSLCSKSAQASRSTFAPAEGSTTDLTNHISEKLNQQNQPCQMFKSQTCQKEASVLLSIWKLLHWKTLFCKREQEAKPDWSSTIIQWFSALEFPAKVGLQQLLVRWPAITTGTLTFWWSKWLLEILPNNVSIKAVCWVSCTKAPGCMVTFTKTAHLFKQHGDSMWHHLRARFWYSSRGHIPQSLTSWFLLQKNFIKWFEIPTGCAASIFPGMKEYPASFQHVMAKSCRAATQAPTATVTYVDMSGSKSN